MLSKIRITISFTILLFALGCNVAETNTLPGSESEIDVHSVNELSQLFISKGWLVKIEDSSSIESPTNSGLREAVGYEFSSPKKMDEFTQLLDKINPKPPESITRAAAYNYLSCKVYKYFDYPWTRMSFLQKVTAYGPSSATILEMSLRGKKQRKYYNVQKAATWWHFSTTLITETLFPLGWQRFSFWGHWANGAYKKVQVWKK